MTIIQLFSWKKKYNPGDTVEVRADIFGNGGVFKGTVLRRLEGDPRYQANKYKTRAPNHSEGVDNGSGYYEVEIPEQ